MARRFDVDDDLATALAGDTSSQLHVGPTDAEENVLDVGLPGDFLEIYLPVHASNGTTIGAYEIYEDASSIIDLIDATRRDVFIVAGLAATILLLMLWGAFNATQRLLASQNGRLLELASDLRGREARFRSLLQNSSDAQAILDADGRVRYESVAVERILGYKAGDWEGRPFASLVHEEDRPTVEQALADLASGQGGERRFDFRIQHSDGTWRTMEAIGRNLLEDPAVGGIVINHRDVTERTVLEAQLTRQAFHDALTGLPNRALFTDRVSHALKRRGRQHRGVVVLFVDLDDFKAINDSLGHQAGDRVLQEVGERLRTTVRPGDTVARLGGDEFAFLLEDVSDPADADEVADRVAISLGAPLAVGGVEVALRASVGIAVAEDSDTAADLLRDADTAMYTAKARGGGSHERFVPAMREAAMSRFELGTDLRRAIDRGEFVLHYQPVVDLRLGRILGFEALIRWQHPTRGLLSPAGFIPAAEATGLIVPIGRWVLEEACRQAREWQLATLTEPPLTMSANLSARELREPGLVEGVADILRANGRRPGHDGARDHRDQHGRGRGRRDRDAPGAQGPRRAPGDRRLRDRLLVAQLPAAAARRRPQAGPLVRRAVGAGRPRVRAGGRGVPPRPLAGARDHRRGDRGRRAARPADQPRLPGRPGLPVRPTDGRARRPRVPQDLRQAADRRARRSLEPGSRRRRLTKKNPGVVGSRGSGGSGLGCGEGIRTPDLRVMSPTSCRCSTPRRPTLPVIDRSVKVGGPASPLRCGRAAPASSRRTPRA